MLESSKFVTGFWAKVNCGSPSECWLWTGGVASCGAGIVYVSSPKKSSTLAHRVAWSLLKGEKLPSACPLRQDCGNRLCVNPAHMTPVTSLVRFWENVDRADPDGCWPWTGRRSEDGYGRFCPDGGTEGPATHYAWELAAGPVPAGKRVLHACDNPPCCRVDHLFLGTNLDNSRDMVAKRRQSRGEKHHAAKLAEADVIEIVAERGTRTAAEAAADRGVCAATVSHIWNRRTWRHLKATPNG